MHQSRLGNLVIDCRSNDLLSEAAFWSAALGFPLPSAPDPGNGFIQLVTPHHEIQVIIQSVRHPPQMHLDIETDQIEREVARLEKLGARIIERKDAWVVMQAPSGHRFCVGGVFRPGFATQANTWP